MILYLDTETTGLRPGNICQLSYIMQLKKSLVAKNLFFTVDYVEPGALSVHGFSVPRLIELSNGKRFKDMVEEVERDFSKADVIVSHNTAFDLMFLRSEFESLGMVFLCRDSFCTMKNMTPVCKLPRRSGAGYKYPKLNELCDYFEITDGDISDASTEIFGKAASFHDARFDTTAVYLAVNKAFGRCSAMDYLKQYI